MSPLLRDSWRLRPITAPLAILFSVLIAVPSAAQTGGSSDPLNPAVTRPVPYISAFDGYRSFRAGTIGDWRSINDAVGAVGGHSGSLREKQTTSPKKDAAEPRPPAVPREPVETAPLGGHGGQKH